MMSICSRTVTDVRTSTANPARSAPSASPATIHSHRSSTSHGAGRSVIPPRPLPRYGSVASPLTMWTANGAPSVAS